MARSIEQARAQRPGVLRLMDVVLKYFVRGVRGFAAFALWIIGPALWGGGPGWSRAVFATLAVLVITVPALARPEAALGPVYLFTNRVQPGPWGPLGFQPDVFDSAPGGRGYTPLPPARTTTWSDDSKARLLTSPRDRTGHRRG